MQINQAFVATMKSQFRPEQFLVNEPMSRHTTFRIGGPADYLFFPSSADEVAAIFSLSDQYHLPLTILGNGSNVLVLDKGIRGVVVKFNSPFSSIRQEGNTIIAGAGAILGAVAQYAAKQGLSGLEFAVGIPGSLGGAIFMNAGAYDGEMKNVVTCVTAVNRQGSLIHYPTAELDFGYRHSIFQENDQAICEIQLQLTPGDTMSIHQKMAGFTERRIKKQPLDLPSAGSTFKRPEGYFAGTLIEHTGLKGFHIGDAQISEKHAGFVVNKGNATAADVLRLIHEVQDRVLQEHGVKLYPEVRILGEE